MATGVGHEYLLATIFGLGSLIFLLDLCDLVLGNILVGEDMGVCTSWKRNFDYFLLLKIV